MVKEGFRVIAPDLRGAINGESDAPQDVQAYNITKVVVHDVAGEHMLFPVIVTHLACEVTCYLLTMQIALQGTAN